MPTAPRMNKPKGGYDFWADTLQPGLFGLYDRWTEQKPWPTPEQINAAVQNPQQLNRGLLNEYLENAADMAVPFAAKLGGLLAHGAMPTGGLFGITTWHGSPHKWTRPDISKVGTGEGAQAYGHGFYSAESKPIAEYYAEQLGGLGWKNPESAARYHPYTLEAIKKEIPYRTPEEIMELNKQYADLGADGGIMADMYNALKSGDVGLTGNLYKLDIPDEDVARYLDWDKPISEQGEIGQQVEAMLPKYRRLPGGAVEFNGKIIDGLTDQIDGRAAYLMLSEGGDMRQAHKRISEKLNQVGIPGIRYLDGTSRSAGEGTYNYVTFDPSRIKVLERNGEDLQGLLGR